MGPLRQPPMRSLRPTGPCRVSVRARPTSRFQDNAIGRQPVLMESDQARALTGASDLTAPGFLEARLSAGRLFRPVKL